MEVVGTVVGQVSWYEWILIGGGVFTALGMLWIKILVPVYNLIKTVEDFYPVVPTITTLAKELEENSITEIKSDMKGIKSHLDEISSDLCEFKDDTEKEILELEKSLNFLNKHAIRTREGRIYGEGMEGRKKYFGLIRRGRWFRSK